MSGLKILQRNGTVRIWSSRMKEKPRHLVCPELRSLSLLLSGGLLPANRVDTVRARGSCSPLWASRGSCAAVALGSFLSLPGLPWLSHLLAGEASFYFRCRFLGRFLRLRSSYTCNWKFRGCLQLLLGVACLSYVDLWEPLRGLELDWLRSGS